MTVPVYVITLASATQRRAFQQAQAQRLGFSPTWHPAMGVNDFPDEVFLQHAFSWQRSLKKTEVGCFMSHLQIWRTIAAGSTPTVVLEDDVILGDGWFETIQMLASQAQADFICLEAWGKKVLGAEQTVGHLKLQRLYLNSAGAAAYVLWPSGAQRLLFQYERYGVALADAFINQVHDWSAWQLVPANVVQMNVAPLYGLPAPVHSDSLIAREKHPSAPPPTIGLVFMMKWRRLKGELNKALRRISSFWLAKRGYVPYLHHDHQ
jgi:glycosyl transferase, family 25